MFDEIRFTFFQNELTKCLQQKRKTYEKPQRTGNERKFMMLMMYVKFRLGMSFTCNSVKAK